MVGKTAKASDLKALVRPKDRISILPSQIKCKARRLQVVERLKAIKKKERKVRRQQNAVDAKMFATAEQEGMLLDDELAKKKKRLETKTIEKMREQDETVITEHDSEIANDEAMDEFSAYFNKESTPKICITTCRKPTSRMFDFIQELLMVFPNSIFFERRNFPIKTIVAEANQEGFTDIVILNEDNKEIHSLMLIHLPHGPTAVFTISNIKLNKEIENHGVITPHNPEVILNNFTTRLGHRVGRMLAALFVQSPHFDGRRVCTFHNQRDYIFFRHHRYIFEEGEAMEQTDARSKRFKKIKRTIARLQELGPQFTLKLQKLQVGTFDSKHGEYEFELKPNMQTSRKKFFL